MRKFKRRRLRPSLCKREVFLFYLPGSQSHSFLKDILADLEGKLWAIKILKHAIMYRLEREFGMNFQSSSGQRRSAQMNFMVQSSGDFKPTETMDGVPIDQWLKDNGYNSDGTVA